MERAAGWELQTGLASASPVGTCATSIPVAVIVVVVVAMVVIIVMMMSCLGEPLRELRIPLNQELRRALRPDEDRVRVEPEVRPGLNVEGHQLEAVDCLQMRRAGRIRAR